MRRKLNLLSLSFWIMLFGKVESFCECCVRYWLGCVMEVEKGEGREVGDDMFRVEKGG